MESRDPTLDVLLDLDGQVFVVDAEGNHWVRFVVTELRSCGSQLSEARAAFKFGPREERSFFSTYRWEPADVQGMLKTAAQFKRTPAELLVLLPEPKGNPGNYPWTGVSCLKSVSRTLNSYRQT